MNAALTCVGDLTVGAAPVLFLHGTTSDSKSNWSWNWVRAMQREKRSYCLLDSPAGGTGDLQISAEYVVRAIRTIYADAGRKLSIVGHSQGGMIARWSFKYWPDTRAMVDDYVALAPSNHGSKEGQAPGCASPLGCSAADLQQNSASNFLTALNDGPETWPGISYTVITTKYDEIISPSSLGFLTPARNVTNMSVQELCPLELVEHFGMAYDNAAWLIGNDALSHDGPAVFARVPKRCGSPWMPAVNPLTFVVDAALAMSTTVKNTLGAQKRSREPELREYAR